MSRELLLSQVGAEAAENARLRRQLAAAHRQPHAAQHRLEVWLLTGHCRGYTVFMTTVPLGEAKDKLSALIDSAETTHDIITITKHGKPAAVLMSADDLESLHETIYWLSRAGLRDDVATADAEYAAGHTVSIDDLRAEHGLPPK